MAQNDPPQIVFATKNDHKLKEISEIMGGSGFSLVSMRKAGIDADIEEIGETFEQNALIKAEEVAKLTGKPSMADDSGLVIDHLNGAPGIYSARYLGEDTPYEIKNKKILEMMNGVPLEKRSARFVCAIAFVWFDNQNEKIILTTEAKMEGFIAYEAAGINGFGYDPIFWLPDYGMTSAQLESSVKNKISHRGCALRLMNEKLLQLFKT